MTSKIDLINYIEKEVINEIRIKIVKECKQNNHLECFCDYNKLYNILHHRTEYVVELSSMLKHWEHFKELGLNSMFEWERITSFEEYKSNILDMKNVTVKEWSDQNDPYYSILIYINKLKNLRLYQYINITIDSPIYDERINEYIKFATIRVTIQNV
jgi:hypothetical protein